MTRRSLLLCVVFAGVAPLSAGCHVWRPFYCGGCYSKGLTPPGASTAGYGPILNRPVINRPVVNWPILNRPVFFPGAGGTAAGAPVDGPPVYADPGFVGGPALGGDGGPGCATCSLSPGAIPGPVGAPVTLGGPVGADFAPGGLIASTGQPVPMLNYGPLPAEYTVPPPAYSGQPSNVLPAPKVYPSGNAATPPTGAGTPMPMTGGTK